MRNGYGYRIFMRDEVETKTSWYALHFPAQAFTYGHALKFLKLPESSALPLVAYVLATTLCYSDCVQRSPS